MNIKEPDEHPPSQRDFIRLALPSYFSKIVIAALLLVVDQGFNLFIKRRIDDIENQY